MDRRAVYLRTNKGLMELMGRTSLLKAQEREVLFLNTGKVSIGEVEARLDAAVAPRLAAILAKLLQEGFLYEAEPAVPSSQTDITNADLIGASSTEPRRSTSISTAPPSTGRSAPSMVPDVPSIASDEFINAALKQAHATSRQQAMVERLQRVETAAVGAKLKAPTPSNDKGNRPASDKSNLQGTPSEPQAQKLDGNAVFSRSAKGAMEVIGRTSALPPELLKLLRCVDGVATVAEIRERVGDASGAVVPLGMQKLLRDDYIRVAQAPLQSVEPDLGFDAIVSSSPSESFVLPSRPATAIPSAAPAVIPERLVIDDGSRALARPQLPTLPEESAHKVPVRAEDPLTRMSPPSSVQSDETRTTARPAPQEPRRRSKNGTRDTPIMHSVDPGRVPPQRAAFRLPNWLVGAIAVGALGIGGFVVAGMLFNTSRYELAATRFFSQPVQVGSVGFAISPRPAIKLSQIVIGNPQVAALATVRVPIDWRMISGSGLVLATIEVEGGTISASALRQSANAKRGTGSDLILRRIVASNLKIVDRDWTLNDVRAQADIDASGTLERLSIANAADTTRVSFTPAANGPVKIEVTSNKLQPFGASFAIDDFAARGTYSSEEVTFDQFDGRLLDGVVKGQVRIRAGGAGGAWIVEGALEGRGLELPRLASAMFRSGSFNAKGRFSSKAASPDGLFVTSALEGTFSADRGVFLLADLSRVVQREESPRGQSTFNELTGAFQIQPSGRLVVSNTRFKSNRVLGAATAHVDPDQSVTGQIAGELATPSGAVRGSVSLGGTVSRPTIAR